MKTIILATLAVMASVLPANAASMIKIDDPNPGWINADRIVALAPLSREVASRSRIGFISVRGELDESIPDDAKFCQISTEQRQFVAVMDCQDVLDRIGGVE